MHDASKVLLGATRSSAKDVSDHAGDPASFPAGLVCRQKSDGTLSVAKADGFPLGISLGKSLSDTKKTAICRTGLSVPIQLTELFASLVVGDLTFTAKTVGSDGNDITITLADTVSAGAEAASVANDTDITIAIEATVSTAAQIKTALEASAAASALVSVEIAPSEESTAQAAAAEDNLAGGLSGSDYVVIGEKAYTDDVSGKANDSNEANTTISDAIYVSDPLTGIAEDGSEVAVALVDIPGGL